MIKLLLVADAYLVGLGVVVALVVYPAFSLVGEGEWSRYHRRHSSAITWAVGPVWALQGLISGWWIIAGPHRTLGVVHGVFALLGVLVTISGAIPAHDGLSKSYDPTIMKRLTRWHLVRTSLWITALLIAIASF